MSPDLGRLKTCWTAGSWLSNWFRQATADHRNICRAERDLDGLYPGGFRVFLVDKIGHFVQGPTLFVEDIWSIFDCTESDQMVRMVWILDVRPREWFVPCNPRRWRCHLCAATPRPESSPRDASLHQGSPSKNIWNLEMSSLVENISKKKQDEAHEPECRHVCWQTETILICHALSKLTCETPWVHTLRWHYCLTFLPDTLVRHSYLTLL